MPLPKPGPGRPKGARNRRSVEFEAEARAKDCTPLQVMQMTVEDLVGRANKAEDDDERTRFLERASDIAAKLAPYVHPRLSAIEYKSQPHEARMLLLGRMTEDELIGRLQAKCGERPLPRLTQIREGAPS